MTRIICVLGGLLIASVALADVPLAFEELDRDGNGYISEEEASVRDDLKEHWATIDKDGNGRLDIGEYQAYEGKERLEPPQESEVPEPGAAPY